MSRHKKSIIYQMYSLGFCGCPEINPIALPDPRPDQTNPVNRLARIRDYYHHFQQMGINTVYLGPIFESCTHGYDIIDHFSLDRRLGNNQLIQEIINELHSLHIRVIIDGCFHHVSRLFPPFVNLRTNRQSSPFLDWFVDIDFSGNTVWNDNFSYKCYQNLSELPVINFQHPEVRHYFKEVAKYWLDRYKIDGWRLDVAYQFTPAEWQEFCQTCYQIRSDCFIYGELVEQNYAEYIREDIFRSATNYQFYQNSWQCITQKNFYQLADFIKYQLNHYQNLDLITFSGSHDTNRLHTQLYHQELIDVFFVLLFTYPDIPAIYYGDEIRLVGIADNINVNIRQPMPPLHSLSPAQQATIHLIKQLIAIRENLQPDLKNLIITHCHSHYLIYHYQHIPEIMIIIHSFDYPGQIKDFPDGNYLNLIDNRKFTILPGQSLHIAPGQPLILKTID